MVTRSRPLTLNEAREYWPGLTPKSWRALLVRPHRCGYPSCQEVRAGQGLCADHGGNPQVFLQGLGSDAVWLRTEKGPLPFRPVQPTKPKPLRAKAPGVKEPPAIWHVGAPPFCSPTTNRGSIPEAILAALPRTGAVLKLEELAEKVGRTPLEIRSALVSMRLARKVVVFSSNEARTVAWLVTALEAAVSDAMQDPECWSFVEQLPLYIRARNLDLWGKTLEAWAPLVARRLIPGLDRRVGVVVHNALMPQPCLEWEAHDPALPRWRDLVWPWEQPATAERRGFSGWPSVSDLKVTTGH
jgi:hypothetical protein